MLGPLGQPIPKRQGQAGGKGEQEGAAHKPGNHGLGAALGTFCKGFFWLLEALAAGQVLILGYFQLLSLPLCCVCRSSSSYLEPCIVTLPLLLQISHSLPLSFSLPLPHHEHNILQLTGMKKGSHTLPYTAEYLPTGPRRGSPLVHTPTENQHAHLKDQRPFPGNRPPTKFLTTTTYWAEPRQQLQLLIPEQARRGSLMLEAAGARPLGGRSSSLKARGLVWGCAYVSM